MTRSCEIRCKLLLRSLLAFVSLSSSVASLSWAATANTAFAQLAWVSLGGSSDTDVPEGVAIDEDGNVFVAGWTLGDLGGAPASTGDVFVSKYDADGGFEWTKELDSGANENGLAVSTDKMGHFYIVGNTAGDLGQPLQSNTDAFLTKFDTDGELIWTRQQAIDNQNIATAVAADSLGNVFTSGFSTQDINTSEQAAGFVSRYDGAGNLRWTRNIEIGAWVQSEGVVGDNEGNVYVTGYSKAANVTGSYSWSDVFLQKYDSNGELLWSTQFGTDTIDVGYDVALDGVGGVYITGHTYGSLAAPITGVGYKRVDAFVSRFDESGDHTWTRQIGSEGRDFAESIEVDPQGNVIIAGFTEGILGVISHGGTDAFVIKLDNAGEIKWTEQLGTAAGDWVHGLALDENGSAYIAGITGGDFGGPRPGTSYFTDMYVAKIIGGVPEPSTSILMLSVLSMLGFRRTPF